MDVIYRYDPHSPVTIEPIEDARAVLQMLCEGNTRLTTFVEQMQRATLGEDSGREVIVPMCPVSLGLPLFAGAIPVHQPFALVLGCSDARVPIEAIFDQSFNDLFVVRIAGNVLGTECMGSVSYAVRTFTQSLKVLVVLGHTGCGAVSAAVETYLNPKDYAAIAFTHPLRSLLDRIMIAVRGAAHALEHVCGSGVMSHPKFKDALIDVAVYLNAAITGFDLRREVHALGADSMPVVYGVYDLATMFVTATPERRPLAPHFAEVPHQEELTDLANALARATATKLGVETCEPAAGEYA